MAKESDVGAMSEDSIAYLEEVKKGKPRKFAMICKGAKVVSLVIYKKGNIESRKKEAKESGKGLFYFGVVDGKGPAIRFVLARADGFESEPVKNSVLKSFLDESAEMKCKPFFEVVDALPQVLDEDDPLVARYLKLQAPVVAACAAHLDRAAELNSIYAHIGKHLDQAQPDEATAKLDALENILSGLSLGTASAVQPSPPETLSSSANAAPPPPPSDAALRFATRLKTLKPAIDAAMAAPGANPDIKLRLSEAAVFARKKEFEQANLLLDQVETLLKSVASPPGDAAAQFMARLKALKPSIDAAIAVAGANPEIKLRVSETAVFARTKDFERANATLDQVELLLKSGTVAASGAVAYTDADFKARLKSLKPGLEQALTAGTLESQAMKLRASEAVALARQGNFDAAFAALDDVEQMLGSTAVDSTALQAALTRWQTERSTAIATLKSLEKAIRDIEDPEANEAIILLKAIQSNLTERPDTLNSVRELQRYLETDDIISEAEWPNGFGISVQIREPLLKALSELAAQLPA